jgi:O-antigen/teichoic acid export membrane protein
LKTIPSILLERRLEFKKLVVSQMIELISFNTIAVFMAAQGAGITSFTFAVLISGIVGVVVIYIIQPWMPGFAFSLRSLKSLLGFGIPYQANSFLAMIKDDGLTAFLGGILGSSGLGFYAWAQKWINMTLRTVLDPTVKVTFPAYSRLQSQQEELAKAVSKSIFYICLFTYPALAGLVLVAPILVRVVPRYEKWEPALFILGLFAINAFWAAVTTPLTNLLNAIGKIKIHFKLMVMWTVLSWLIIPGFGMKFGITGAAFGTAIVGTSSIIAIWIARRLVPFDVIRSVGQPLFATLVMSLAIFVLRNLFPPSFLFVFLLVAFAVFFYFGLIFWLAGNRLISDFHYMLQARLPS